LELVIKTIVVLNIDKMVNNGLIILDKAQYFTNSPVHPL